MTQALDGRQLVHIAGKSQSDNARLIAALAPIADDERVGDMRLQVT